MTKAKHNLIISLLLILSFIIFSTITLANNPGDQGVNITSQVNVTNAYPIIDKINMPDPFDLIPGTTAQLNCTIEAHDWNGWGDIVQVNATLWDNSTVGMGAADDNETHYTIDTNCTFGGTSGQYNRTFYCSFDVWYYANAGSNWVCNATVMDNSSLNSFNYNTTTINNLYALNVTSPLDFGDGIVGSTIFNKTANITNFGNQLINISVDAYGVTDADSLAMDCFQGTIPLQTAASDNMRYTVNSSQATTWGSLTGVTDTATNITDLSVSKVTDATRGQASSWYNTFWALRIPVPSNPFGMCYGVVVFTAWSA